MPDHNEIFKKAQEAFLNELEKIKGITKRPTILILGYTGIGKTSLVQHILGKSIVDDSKITHGSRGTTGFVEYSDEFITIIDSMGFEPNTTDETFINMTKALVHDRQKRENIQEHIHLVWYCIAGVNARVTPTDLKLISEISQLCKLQVVITKSDVARTRQKEEVTTKLLENGVNRDQITMVSVPDPDEANQSGSINEGVQELVDKSLALLPEAYKATFISKQVINLEYKRKQAEELIEKRATSTGLLGIIPFIDIPIIIPMQIEMIARISNIYGFDVTLSKQLIGASSIATLVTALTANSFLDTFPIIGQLLSGGATFAITKSVGYLTSDYFMECSKEIVNGKDISHLKPYSLENLKRYFQKFYQIRK